MTPPKFPACTTIPEVVQRPGDVVTLKAAGFDAPGEEVDVFLDAELIANVEPNRAGNMSTDVAIPKETRGEPRLITIRVGNSALTAECVAATASTRSSDSIGVNGGSINAPSVRGNSTNCTSVHGDSTNRPGVLGTNTNAPGVDGESTNGPGVWGRSNDYPGVRGDSPFSARPWCYFSG